MCAALHAVRKPRPRVRRSERQGKPLTKLAQGAKTLESSVSQWRGGCLGGTWAMGRWLSAAELLAEVTSPPHPSQHGVRSPRVLSADLVACITVSRADMHLQLCCEQFGARTTVAT